MLNILGTYMLEKCRLDPIRFNLHYLRVYTSQVLDSTVFRNFTDGIDRFGDLNMNKRRISC